MGSIILGLYCLYSSGLGYWAISLGILEVQQAPNISGFWFESQAGGRMPA